MESLIQTFDAQPTYLKLFAYVALAAVTHSLVVIVRRIAHWVIAKGSARKFAKFRTIGILATSIVIFTLYFAAGGFILNEMGISLTAYLASASVVGLAIGFGSQGVVQDVVTGLTLIFSDLIDVGDLVEVSGQTGVVKAITMRFIELQNAMGASVFIPNRTINNVINYPRGYVRCIVDVTLLGTQQEKQEAEKSATSLMQSVHEQFPAILITAPSVEGRLQLQSGRELLRIKFRIWPNRGQPIESVYAQELTAHLQEINDRFKPWMISVSYEVEKAPGRRPASSPGR
jgi:small conductance mechanosensitive channel